MKDSRLIYVALLLYALGFVLLFGSWMLISYQPPKENGPALGLWITATLGALVGHILTILTGDWSSKDAPAVGPASGSGGEASSRIVVTSPAVTVAPAAQGGFATIPGILLLIVMSLAFISVTGCASLTQAGNTAYSVEPVLGSDGKPSGEYKMTVNDGKEFSSRTINFMKGASGNVVLQVDEGASSAFQGQAIAGKALSVLPSFAAPILAPGPAVVVPQLQAAPAAAVKP